MNIGDFFGYAEVSGTIFTGSASTFPILGPNPNRLKIILATHSDDPTGGNVTKRSMWCIKFGDGSSHADHTFHVDGVTNPFVELGPPMYTGSISGYQDSATGSLMVTEFTAVDRNY